MSLIRIAVRTAIVQALKNCTFAGSNVLDSEIGIIDINDDGITIDDKFDKPFIAVYSDAGVVNGSGTDLRSLTLNGSVDLTFEIGVTALMAETNDKGESTLVGIDIPVTDRSMEYQLDLIVRQIFVTLTDPANEWSQIFLSLTSGFQDYQRARISTGTDGLRRAAQQIKIKASLVADPVWGAPVKPASPFNKFLEKLDTACEPDLVTLATLLRAQLGEPVEEANINQRRYGMTMEEMRAMMLPVPGEGQP